MTRPVNVGLVACGESFKAIIWVREDEYFQDGVLLVSKLRNRLSCNMGVLFLAQALVQITQKASDFIANNLIFTQAMKDSNTAIVETNKLLLEQSDAYKKAKEGLESFGAAGSDSTRLQLDALKEQLATQQKIFAQGPQQINQAKQVSHEYIAQTGWLAKAYDWGKSIVTGTKEQAVVLHEAVTAAQDQYLVANATVKALQEQQALLEKQLDTEHAIEAIKQGGETKEAGAKLRAAKKQAEVAEDANTADARKRIAEQLEDELYRIKQQGMQQQLAILKENDENTKDAQAKLLSEMKVAADNQATVVLDRLVKAKDDLEKTLEDMAKTVHHAVPDIEIITPVAVQNILNGIGAAKSLGITLKQDLVQAYLAAKQAQDDFMKSGIQDGVAQTAIANNILKAKAALDAYGTTVDKFKAKSHGLWGEFRTDTKEGATAMDQVSQLGVDAFDDLTKAMEGAFASAIAGQQGFGKALEQATAKALISIASQAAVKAIFYTAEGFAELALGVTSSSAAELFTAAGLMASVAGAAGVAGKALSGNGGSGSQNTGGQSLVTGGSNTSGSGLRGGTSVHAFADGGLIAARTARVKRRG